MKAKPLLEQATKESLALTFDDVRLKTGYSEVMPDDVSLESRFSTNVELKIPIVAAPMDTVTEHKLAIELAKFGGLGIIHRNLSPEEQASEIGRVKRHLNGLIENPVCVYEDERIASILQKRDENGYAFHSFPVLDRQEKIVGLLTGNDFEFCSNMDLPAREVMTSHPVTASRETSIDEAYEVMLREKKKVLPLINDAKEVIGMYVFTDLKRIKTGSEQMYNVDERGQLKVGAAVSAKQEEFERVEKLLQERVDVIVVETAHADSKGVIEMLKAIKSSYPRVDVVVGNISVGESARRLVEAGADGIKVGQGPGSICTTRVVAGIGRPQVSAVYDCAQIAEASGIPVCADGGLRNSGDIPIAIGAGAHTVMLGSMLAGTEESPGEIVFFEGRQWKRYRGMGSLGAMEAGKGSRDRYRQRDAERKHLVPEGVEGLVPYRGTLSDVVIQYIGGLKRGMGYIGAASIEELRDKGDFERITTSGFAESHPHNIKITKEPPNYEIER